MHNDSSACQAEKPQLRISNRPSSCPRKAWVFWCWCCMAMIAPHQTLVLSLATHSPSHPGHFAALLLLAWLVLPIVDKLALLHLNRAVPLRTPWTSLYRHRHRSLYFDFHINTGADTAGESRCASFTSLRFISSPLFQSGIVDCSAYLCAPTPNLAFIKAPPDVQH